MKITEITRSEEARLERYRDRMQSTSPRAPREVRQIMTVTPAAAERIAAIFESRDKDKPSFGIRIGVRGGGCNGMSYTLEFADELEPMDETVLVGDTKILIDPKAAMFLIGTEMDYETDFMKSGFLFHNPNEKGRCGCGNSFNV